jgi:uncharacterized YccA/Bax inhibitor family protein
MDGRDAWRIFDRNDTHLHTSKKSSAPHDDVRRFGRGICGSGIVFQAGLGTLCLVGGMYGLYATRIIKATPMFQRIVISLTLGIFLLYISSFILSLIPGSLQIPFLHSNGPVGIFVTVFILGVASANLILDFNFIESGIKQQTPKVGEWWGAFGLLVTVIWIYWEMLRLLSKVRSNMN